MSYDVKQDQERLRRKPVFVLVALTTLVMTVGALVAVALLEVEKDRLGLKETLRLPTEIPEDIHGIKLSQIESTKYGKRIMEAQREALSSYSWKDRDKGLVRIPIEHAMDLLLEEK